MIDMFLIFPLIFKKKYRREIAKFRTTSLFLFLLCEVRQEKKREVGGPGASTHPKRGIQGKQREKKRSSYRPRGGGGGGGPRGREGDRKRIEGKETI